MIVHTNELFFVLVRPQLVNVFEDRLALDRLSNWQINTIQLFNLSVGAEFYHRKDKKVSQKSATEVSHAQSTNEESIAINS